MTSTRVPGTMRALVFTAPGESRIEELAVPAVEPGECLVRVAYVGLCGADAALFDGSSVYLREGLKRHPFVPGHEWSGTVVQVAAGVTGFAVGDRVAGHNFVTCGTCGECRRGRRAQCLERSEIGVLGERAGAACGYLRAPANTLAHLPPEVDLRTAAVLEPATSSLHAVARLGIRDDDVVAVLGTGTLGLVATQLARDAGARVHAIGVDRGGLELARELGADRALRPEQAEHDAYSAVIEASGAASAAALAPRLVGHGGRLALVGVANRAVEGFPAAHLVLKNAVVHGVLSGIDQWDRLIALVSRGRVDLAALIDSVLPLSAAKEALAALGNGRRERPKILLEIHGEGDR